MRARPAQPAASQRAMLFATRTEAAQFLNEIDSALRFGLYRSARSSKPSMTSLVRI